MTGTITALEAQKRNPERVNVYLDGEFAFGLAAITAARLQRGQTLSDAEIAALKAQDAIDQAVDQAVRLLTYRPRSTAEIRRYLGQKGAAPEVIDAALARLEQLGYLDDLAFARFWVANRDEFNPKGPLALRQELSEKGVPRALVDQAMAEVDFTDAAYRALMRRARHLQGQDRREVKRRVYDFLARRGFAADTIREVAARVLDELGTPTTNLDDDTFEE